MVVPQRMEVSHQYNAAHLGAKAPRSSMADFLRRVGLDKETMIAVKEHHDIMTEAFRQAIDRVGGR